MKHGILRVGACLTLLSVSVEAQSPIPVSPGGKIRIGSVAEPCPTFLWTVPEALGSVELVVYEVPRETDQGDVTPVLSVTLPGSAHGWTPSLDGCLERGRRYAWSVRPETDSGPGAWSEARLFEVDDAPSIGEVEEALRVLHRYVGENGPGIAAAEEQSLQATRLGPEPELERPARRDIERRTQRQREERRPLSSQTVGAGVSRAVVPPASYALELDGDFALGGHVFKEGKPFLHNDGGSGNGNTALGLDALISTTIGAPYPNSGMRNTALGEEALRDSTSGRGNTAVGASALLANTDGALNTAVGESTLTSNQTGDGNTAIGVGALRNNDTGNFNVALGSGALLGNTSQHGSRKRGAAGQRSRQPEHSGRQSFALFQPERTLQYRDRGQCSHELDRGPQHRRGSAGAAGQRDRSPQHRDRVSGPH